MHRYRAKTQIMLMNRAQPGLEQEVQEVLDFIIIKFLLSLKVPAQSYNAELMALKIMFWTTLRVLCPVLGSPVQERYGTGESAGMGHRATE